MKGLPRLVVPRIVPPRQNPAHPLERELKRFLGPDEPVETVRDTDDSPVVFEDGSVGSGADYSVEAGSVAASGSDTDTANIRHGVSVESTHDDTVPFGWRTTLGVVVAGEQNRLRVPHFSPTTREMGLPIHLFRDPNFYSDREIENIRPC
jgi:hypothetical protein